jgi:tripartite ATP-independent transporter DctM subunit
MSALTIAGLALAVLVTLLALRMPIWLALSIVAVGGIAALRGPHAAFAMLGSTPHEFVASWTLTAVPMFLLMGALAFHSGFTSGLYNAARLWLGSLPGGLAIATNFAAAGFSAASGSSVATAAAVGRLAVPEMLRCGYQPGLATAVCAASGTLGVMIPPSIAFVLYGWYTETPIGKLLLAGILPGLLTAAIYAALIAIRCKLNPALAPKLPDVVVWRDRFVVLARVWPLPLVILGIIGGIYGGVATTTEVAAMGAALVLAIALARREMSWPRLKEACVESLEATASIFFIAVGATLITRFLAIAGMPAYLAEQVQLWGLDPFTVIAAMTIIYVILGCFIDPIGIMLLTLPILTPILISLKVDMVWVGVLVVKYLEIGLMTPPVGLNAFVIKAVAGDSVSLTEVFRGLGWFLGAEVVIVALLLTFPEISLFLPSLLD